MKLFILIIIMIASLYIVASLTYFIFYYHKDLNQAYLDGLRDGYEEVNND